MADSKPRRESFFYEDEVQQVSFRDKLRIWWHYYKYIVLIIILATAGLIWIVRVQMAPKQPDYRIGVVAPAELPLDTRNALMEQLLPFCEDLNGDGEVLLSIDQFTLDFEATDKTEAYGQMAGVTRLSTNVKEDNCCYIFLLKEPESFERNTSLLQYLDGSTPAAEGADADKWQDMCLAWTDCPVLTGLDLGSYKGLTLMDDLVGDSQEIMADYFVGRRILNTPGQQAHQADWDVLWDKMTDGAAVSR